VNLGAGNLPGSSTCASGKLPAMALDSGIHAGMTAFLGRRDLCITMRSGAWERAKNVELLQPVGLPAISRGLSEATPPDNAEKTHDPGGVAAIGP